ILLALVSLVSLSHSQCKCPCECPIDEVPVDEGQVSPASQCSGGIPAAEVKGFLDVHNKLRQSISAGNYVARGRRMPAARTLIPNLVWDCGLEKSAQAVTSTCIYAHSKNRNNTGENLYKYWSSDQISIDGMGKGASDYWEEEFQEIGWPDIKFTNAVSMSGVGHATQMTWAKSTKIGCGITRCRGGLEILVACHYRDAGNIYNQNVYEPR
ncbi:hypothetical protein PMAYCL1PPCAC_05571, partial [Pristionchus mayeri]